MLKSITWLQFFEVMMIGSIAYYIWYVFRFWSRELQVFAKGEKIARPELQGGSPVGSSNGGNMGGASASGGQGTQMTAVLTNAAPAAEQPVLFNEKTVPAGESPEMFKVMERVIDLLKKTIQDSSSTGIQRDELLDRFYEVLKGFHHLRRTPYESAINNFLTRSCTTHFSLLLTEGDIKSIWGY